MRPLQEAGSAGGATSAPTIPCPPALSPSLGLANTSPYYNVHTLFPLPLHYYTFRKNFPAGRKRRVRHDCFRMTYHNAYYSPFSFFRDVIGRAVKAEGEIPRILPLSVEAAPLRFVWAPFGIQLTCGLVEILPRLPSF